MESITAGDYSTRRLYGMTCPQCKESDSIYLNDDTDMVQCQVCNIEGDEDEFILNRVDDF